MKTCECLKCSTLWSDDDWKLKIVIGDSLDEIIKLYFHLSMSIINRVMLIKSLWFFWHSCSWTDVVVSNLFTTVPCSLNSIWKNLLESVFSVTRNNIPLLLTSNINRWSSIPFLHWSVITFMISSSSIPDALSSARCTLRSTCHYPY